MKISLELSLYPLDKNYGTTILDFIQRLKKYPQLELTTNTMSSQVFGEYDEIMPIIQREVKASFLEDKDMVVVMKMVNVDLN